MKKSTTMLAIILSLVMALSLTAHAADTKAARNPGLGIRGLHAQGITGKGVNVAYIGMGLGDDGIKGFTHPEFRDGFIKQYVDFGWDKVTYDELYMMVSPMVGKTVGTAPDVNVYHLGLEPSKHGKVISAIDWVIKKNESLSGTDKIRIINLFIYGEMYDGDAYCKALERAAKAGIVVVAPDRYEGWDLRAKLTVYGESGYYNPSDPENVSKAKVGRPGDKWYTDNMIIHAPSVLRTVAWRDQNGKKVYKYIDGQRDFDEGVASSYVAGVLAMGFQVNPNISVSKIVKILRDTQTNDVINPPKFIEAVKAA